MDLLKNLPNCIAVSLLEGIELLISEVESIVEFIDFIELSVVLFQETHTLIHFFINNLAQFVQVGCQRSVGLFLHVLCD